MALYAYRRVIASERACWALVHRLRWPHGPRCPQCAHLKPWRMHHRGRPAYRCRQCHAHFNVLTGTALADTRIPLSKWVLAIGLFKIGISSRALARELAVSPQTAWQLLHRLRRAVQHLDWLQQLHGQIEMDDTYVGGKRKGPRGRGARHKTLVIGLKERGGRVRSLAVTALTSPTIHAILRAHVARGARIYTDEFSAYRRLSGLGVSHRRIKHIDRFVRGQTHTQGIESYWGHLKPTLVARHRSVAPHHLQKYLAEADLKRNFGHDRDFIAFMLTQLTTCEPALPHY